MSISYPTAQDTFTNPTSGSYQNSPDHPTQHADANDAIEALEAKLGSGSSTPVANKALLGTGTGTSAYGYIDTAYLADALINYTKLSADLTSGWVVPYSFVNGLETWAYVSADAPTFVVTVPTDATTKFSVGMRVEITQTTKKYFIITAVAATSITLYGGTDYTLTNDAITAVRYSTQKAPFGFPLDPAKWSVTMNDASERTQATPTSNVWYNLGTTNSQITVPIGSWNVDYAVTIFGTCASSAYGLYTALSTSNSSVSEPNFATRSGGLTTTTQYYTVKKSYTVTVASKTLYYMIAKLDGTTPSDLRFNNSSAALLIRAVCAYL